MHVATVTQQYIACVQIAMQGVPCRPSRRRGHDVECAFDMFQRKKLGLLCTGYACMGTNVIDDGVDGGDVDAAIMGKDAIPNQSSDDVYLFLVALPCIVQPS